MCSVFLLVPEIPESLRNEVQFEFSQHLLNLAFFLHFVTPLFWEGWRVHVPELGHITGDKT